MPSCTKRVAMPVRVLETRGIGVGGERVLPKPAQKRILWTMLIVQAPQALVEMGDNFQRGEKLRLGL